MNPLPQFLCIGTQKAGTSWLFEQLRQHPQVWLPPIKELHYFDHLYCPDNRSWTRWHIRQAAGSLIKSHVEKTAPIDFNYIRYIASMASKPMFTEAWYRRIYNIPLTKDKIVGDVTPEYCAIGDEGITHVRRLLGDVNIIWLIRDPVERALSQVRMKAQRQGLSEQALKDKWQELADSPEIMARGNYADYIPRWESQFGRSGILFVPFQHIALDPQAVLQKIEKFIGVTSWDGYAAPEKKIHATPSYDFPDAARIYFAEQFQAQYQFLESYFTDDFVKAI